MRALFCIFISILLTVLPMEGARDKKKRLKEPVTITRIDTVTIVDTIRICEETPLIIKIDSSYLLDDTLLNPLSYVDTSIDSLYLQWREEGLLKTNTDCVEMPDNQDIPDEVFLQRIAALPNVIPCSYNKIVRRFIEMYLYQRPGQVSSMLAMSDYYFPIFEEALERHQLPLELKYLPIIESALNPNAVSRVGATGLWQFMLPTARGLGM